VTRFVHVVARLGLFILAINMTFYQNNRVPNFRERNMIADELRAIFWCFIIEELNQMCFLSPIYV
jgi:hypothetical protein